MASSGEDSQLVGNDDVGRLGCETFSGNHEFYDTPASKIHQPGQLQTTIRNSRHAEPVRRTSGGILERLGGHPRSAFPMHPILLAAYPVLFLFAQNLDGVSLANLAMPLARAIGAAGVMAAVAWILPPDPRRGALVATALVVAWLYFGRVATLLAPLAVGQTIQLVAWGLFLGVALVAAFRLRDRWISSLTSALNAIGVVLVVMTLVQIVPYEWAHQPAAAAERPAMSAPAGARDIYYFILDRYGSNQGLQAWADVTSDLPTWLAAQGFAVEAGARANYVRTDLSLAATLNMESLDSVAAKMGPTRNDLGPVDALLQDNAAGQFLEARGYRYVNIGSWYNPTQSIRIADQNLFWNATTDFDAMLDKTTFGPTLANILNLPAIPSSDAIHRNNALYQFSVLPGVEQEPGPKFVVAHILLPHPPYVFDLNGSYPSAAEQKGRTEGQAFETQITYLNAQVRSIVTGLLSRPADKQPIIVIQADEGPYPDRYQADEANFDWSTATSNELEAKYGILDAFYLPGAAVAGTPEPYATVTSWNTFPIVFDRYFGANIPLLPDRSFTSSGYTRPYDLTDVTTRLPPPAGS